MSALITIHMARKPLEGTVAETALKYGTGSLNIGATRIGTGDNLNGGAYAENPSDHPNPEEWRFKRGGRTGLPGDKRQGASAGMFAEGAGHLSGQYQQPKGRWPANIIFNHLDGCELVGALSESFNINVYRDPNKGNYSFYQGSRDPHPTEISSKGMDQVVDQWMCVPGCPVTDIDEQSCVTFAKRGGRGIGYSGSTIYGGSGTPGFDTVRGFSDQGGVSRYFKQTKSSIDLIEYLRAMISTPDAQADVVSPGRLKEWFTVDHTNVCGVVYQGTLDADDAARLLGVLLPGGHILRIAPDSQPTGHTGAILLEDAGFEIRDAILLVRGPGRTHYVTKAGRKEREAGCGGLKGKAGHEAVERKEGSAGVANPRAGAGRTANHVKNYHPCLHPDALVMTDLGYRPIHEIKGGHMVYGEDGQFHPVDVVSSHPYTSEVLFEIAVQGTNYTTLASDNHLFLIWRPTRKGKSIVGGDVVWVEAKDVRKGDYTMTPLLVDTGVEDERPDEWWWVFGLWLAEGVLQRAGHGSNVYPSFSLHQDETHLVERLRRFFEGRGFSFSVYPKSGKGIQVMGFDPEVGNQFQKWSPCGAGNKQIPYTIWHRQRSTWRAVFEGYMAGDDGKVRSWRQAKTVSPDLASQIRLLGEALGTKANLFRYKAQPSYQIRFYDRDMNQTSRKPARPTTVEHQGVTFRLSYVQKVTPVAYKGAVWNLTVRESPTFQTAVGMSHNTCKPIKIMENLLIDIPLEATVLDPFLGSGTTAIACLKTGHSFIGIEKEAEYLEIADARVRHWDRAHVGWQGAEIESDHVSKAVESETLNIMDFFE